MERNILSGEIEIIPITLPALDVQTSSPQFDGSVIVRLHVVLPKDLFSSPTPSLLTLSGAPSNALQGAIVQTPHVQFLCRADKLSPEVVAQARAASGDASEE